MPVGMLIPAMVASSTSSRYFTIARIELPCAATSVVLPACRSGTMSDCQYGSARSSTCLSASARGIGSPA